ncbi:radical SAM protein [Marinilabiliaceae bacterium ANBcel2]|nr:radical SAM protein [Marinilabiliaceae bacterium ANBcel2]
MITVYRPKWTSGRYHKIGNERKALLYNKMEGMSFLFEEDSADIINEVLKYEVDEPIPIPSLIKIGKEEYLEDDIIVFCNDLINFGLLTLKIFDSTEVSRIRKIVSEQRKNEINTVEKTIQEKLPFEISSAESDYSKFIEKDGIPLSVMIELTYNCNERCIHCYNPGAARNNNEKSERGLLKELDYNDYVSLIKELKELGVAKISLTGGEPFIKNDIWKLIELIHKQDFSFDIFTNGLALIDNVDKLIQHFPQSVRLSVYSADEEIHDSITRIKGSLAKTLKVASVLQKNGVPIYFNCPIMKNNLSSYHTVSDLAKKYSALAQFDVNLTDSLDGNIAISQQLQVSNKELEILLRDPNIPLYVGKEAPDFGKKTLQIDEPFCGAGINLFNITPEGNVTPCNSFPTSFGNLKDKSFKDIVSGSEILKKWQNITVKDYEECGAYEQCWYCNRCPGQSFIEHGNPLKKSTANHNLAKVRCELAKKIEDGNDPLDGKNPYEVLNGNVILMTTKVKSVKAHKNHRNNTLKLK